MGAELFYFQSGAHDVSSEHYQRLLDYLCFFEGEVAPSLIKVC
jgi:hypothetical protein